MATVSSWVLSPYAPKLLTFTKFWALTTLVTLTLVRALPFPAKTELVMKALLRLAAPPEKEPAVTVPEKLGLAGSDELGMVPVNCAAGSVPLRLPAVVE